MTRKNLIKISEETRKNLTADLAKVQEAGYDITNISVENLISRAQVLPEVHLLDIMYQDGLKEAMKTLISYYAAPAINYEQEYPMHTRFLDVFRFCGKMLVDSTYDDFNVDAELQKPTFTKSGDIWTLGQHRLICGDATREETYAALMDGRKANLVITDPPYNVNYEGSAGKIKNDNMASEKFFDFLFDAFSNMEKVMADDASIYVFHADTEGLNFRKAFDAAGFYLSGCCIWKKQSLVLGRSPYQWQHEPSLYGWKKKRGAKSPLSGSSTSPRRTATIPP